MATRAGRKRKRDIPTSKNRQSLPKLEAIPSSDEEDTPTAYEILLNSLPTQSKYSFPRKQSPSTKTKFDVDVENDDVIECLNADDEEEDLLDEVGVAQGEEPFSAHYDRILDEAHVTTLNELYSQPLPLTCHKCKELGLVQWLTTPTSNKTWSPPDQVSIMHPLKVLHVREPIATLWPMSNKTSVKEPFTSLQRYLFDIMNSYKDLVFTCRSHDNEMEIRQLYVLHLLNHVIKNRTRVLKNNVRLTLAAKDGRDLGEIRDQGLTRPKVLILVPFRNSALKIVKTMIDAFIKPGKGEVANSKKFFHQFEEGEESTPPSYKPNSYLHLFSGNTDDCFKMGMAIKKNRVKLYSTFYSSDIIIASPLGLRTIIGGEGDKKREYDFLSSIEMVIVDQIDVLLMQNWDHVLHLFNHLHLKPIESHGVDFSRVREWSLNCWGKHYCQTLVFSAFPTPEINALITTYCHNYEGQVRVHTPVWKGSVCQILQPVPQIFHRLTSPDHHQLPEIRFQYFIDTVLPKLLSPSVDHVCIYVPSYFDFIRLRNHFKREGYNFCHISEYAKPDTVSRARSFFADGRKKFLLITERLHFFRRYHFRGIHYLVFYGPPTYTEFYSELVNQMEAKDNSKVIVLYSKYDTLSLQRIVGNERTPTLVSSSDNVHTLIVRN